MGDVLRLAGDEIVDADHLMPLRQEQVGQVGAEKPAPPEIRIRMAIVLWSQCIQLPAGAAVDREAERPTRSADNQRLSR